MEELKQFLIDSDLSVEQYFIIMLLNEDPEYLEEYLLKIKNKIDKISIFQDLLLKGFIMLKDIDEGYVLHNIIPIKNINSIIDFDVGKDFVRSTENVSNELEQCWKEFIELYPKTVNGRPLHNTKEKNKLKYFRYLKSGVEHSKVVKGLNAEITARKNAQLRKQFFPEWQLLSTYINNKSWEQFLDLYSDINENKSLTFGTDGRITRTF